MPCPALPCPALPVVLLTRRLVPGPDNPCVAPDQGGCSDFCTLDAAGRVACRCADGRALQPDGQSYGQSSPHPSALFHPAIYISRESFSLFRLSNVSVLNFRCFLFCFVFFFCLCNRGL